MELGNIIFGYSRGQYSVPRGIWEERFYNFLEKINSDNYGYANDQHHPNVNSRGGFETTLFTINPYWWGSYDDDEVGKPNFIYHPTGYHLTWYKYPLRDAYANQKMTYKEFDLMLKDCEGCYHG